MIRKTILSLICLSILAGGYIAVINLRYVERISMIFKLNSSQSFSGRAGRDFREERGFRNGERQLRPDMRELPDGIRQRFESGVGGSERSGRREDPHGEGRTRGGGGHKINLRNVAWFSLVFASFTVTAVYLDKINYYFRRRKIVTKM